MGDASRRVHVPGPPYYCQSYRQIPPSAGSSIIPLHGIGEAFHGKAFPTTRTCGFLHLLRRIPSFQFPHRSRRSVGDVNKFGELLGPNTERGIVSAATESNQIIIVLIRGIGHLVAFSLLMSAILSVSTTS